MTVKYEAVSRHTKEVLEDFIKFDNQVRHPLSKYHLLVLGIGFFVLGFLVLETGLAPAIVSWALAVMLLGLLMFRRKIAFYKLSMEDEDYQKQSEFLYQFGQTRLVIKNPNWDGPVNMDYREITSMYLDEKNLYICRNNEELYLLPKKDLVRGEAKELEEFLKLQSEKEWLPVKMSFKEHVKRINEKRKEADRRHDEAIRLRRETKKKGNETE